MIVIDASVAIELLLLTPKGLKLLDRIWPKKRSEHPSLHAPHLIELEVTQVLRRFWKAGSLTSARAEQALRDLEALGVQRMATTPLVSRIWQLRHNLTAYDAAYVALAEVLEAPFLTCDQRIAGAPGVRAKVEVV